MKRNKVFKYSNVLSLAKIYVHQCYRHFYLAWDVLNKDKVHSNCRNYEKLGNGVKEILPFFKLIINISPGSKQPRLLSYFQRLPKGEQKS